MLSNPLHRILKVAEVRIETGGGAEPEAALQVISLAALDEMRREVLGRRTAAAPSLEAVGSAADQAQSEIILHLAPAELMLSGFIHSKGILVVGAVFSLLYEFDLFENLLPAWLDDLTPWRVLFRQSKFCIYRRGGSAGNCADAGGCRLQPVPAGAPRALHVLDSGDAARLHLDPPGGRTAC